MNLLLTPHIAFGTDPVDQAGDFENSGRLMQGE